MGILKEEERTETYHHRHCTQHTDIPSPHLYTPIRTRRQRRLKPDQRIRCARYSDGRAKRRTRIGRRRRCIRLEREQTRHWRVRIAFGRRHNVRDCTFVPLLSLI